MIKKKILLATIAALFAVSASTTYAISGSNPDIEHKLFIANKMLPYVGKKYKSGQDPTSLTTDNVKITLNYNVYLELDKTTSIAFVSIINNGRFYGFNCYTNADTSYLIKYQHIAPLVSRCTHTDAVDLMAVYK